MVKKKKRKNIKKNKNKPSNNNLKIKNDHTGLFVWIGYLVVGSLLYSFSEIGFLIFCGFVLLTIIKRISDDVI
jgi:hypothetical protein